MFKAWRLQEWCVFAGLCGLTWLIIAWRTHDGVLGLVVGVILGGIIAQISRAESSD